MQAGSPDPALAALAFHREMQLKLFVLPVKNLTAPLSNLTCRASDGGETAGVKPFFAALLRGRFDGVRGVGIVQLLRSKR